MAHKYTQNRDRKYPRVYDDNNDFKAFFAKTNAYICEVKCFFMISILNFLFQNANFCYVSM